MKAHTKAFVLWLPMMVAATLLGWLVFGALPNMHMTGDLIAWLMELPVTTCYAIAAGAATFLTLQVAGVNIDNDARADLMRRAHQGDRNARDALRDETLATISVLMLWSVFFFPHY
jgi:hypothetical protein